MRARLLIIAIAAALALVAGCSGSGGPPATNGVENLTADEILDRATDALQAAASFRMQGKGEADGEAIEADAVFAGDNLQGTFNIDGNEFELVVVDGGTYFKADLSLIESFLGEEAEAMAPLFANKYIKFPSGGSPFDIDAADAIEMEGEVTKGEITTLEGKQVITLIDSEGTKLYVSLVGEPYPLQMESSEGTMKILDIGASVTIEAPDPADVVDLQELMNLAP